MKHNFLILLNILECRDLLRLIVSDSAKQYKIPDTLKKMVQDYAHATIMSPSIVSYRSPKLPAIVLSSMRELNVADLSPASETGWCDVIIACIGKGLTDWRCHVKNQIIKSVQEKENARDIATLTHACIGSSKAKPTAAVYLRLAFLRHIVHATTNESVNGKDDDKFWVTVDKVLDTWRHSFPSVTALHW
ncbi:hypothetical protein AcV5_003844 [Taiwanofungus camphoratus]|nr:hypothetical protein AcV5_003844 [Antrodia cinnamomea]